MAFINHETDQYPLTFNLSIKWIGSNTTNPILTVEDEIPVEDELWDYVWLSNPEQLSTITATAEHTLGLILACHRQLPKAMEHVQDGKWNRYDLGVPKMLSRSVITIIGYGRIGKMLASYCEPLFKTVCIVTGTPGWSANLNLLLPGTDVLVITASKQPHGECIIGEKELSLLPEEAIVVNTSVPENLDSDQALKALKSGHISALGLDVLSESDQLFAWIAEYHPSLIITPHIGGSTQDAWHDTQQWIIERVISELGE